MKIGVLALQGAFREHLETLAAIGVAGVPVRKPADLDGVGGLILPDGESTTMRKLSTSPPSSTRRPNPAVCLWCA